MLSRSQIDRLGGRLKASAEVSPEDLMLLQQLRSEHDAAMLYVARRLIDELGVEPGTRLKTVGTIVDKLRRENIRLSQMQDIAGVRLVADMSLAEQDELVARITSALPASRVVDRRSAPSHGYRAVHVIVEVERRYVEVQVRTEWQHLWAQVFEAMADVVGRGIRYGLSPAIRTLPSGASVEEMVRAWEARSEDFGRIELLESRLADHPDQELPGSRSAALAVVRILLDRLSTMRPLDP